MTFRDKQVAQRSICIATPPSLNFVTTTGWRTAPMTKNVQVLRLRAQLGSD